MIYDRIVYRIVFYIYSQWAFTCTAVARSLCVSWAFLLA